MWKTLTCKVVVQIFYFSIIARISIAIDNIFIRSSNKFGEKTKHVI